MAAMRGPIFITFKDFPKFFLRSSYFLLGNITFLMLFAVFDP